MEHLGYLGVGGRIQIGLDVKETGYEGVKCILLAQVRDFWRAFVNTAMNFRVS
jgi:hypothetical protein